MLKKILIVLALVLSLQMLQGVFMEVPMLYAAEEPAPPAEGDIDAETFMFDLGAITHESIEGTTRQSWIRQGINYFFERIIGFMAAVIGSLSVLMLMVGGFMMLASGGNESMHTKGVGYAKYALIGLAVTLCAYILVTLVQLLISSIYG